MALTRQQTQQVLRIDTHVRHVLAQGGGDEALLLSMADYMGTFCERYGSGLPRASPM